MPLHSDFLPLSPLFSVYRHLVCLLLAPVSSHFIYIAPSAPPSRRPQETEPLPERRQVEHVVFEADPLASASPTPPRHVQPAEEEEQELEQELEQVRSDDRMSKWDNSREPVAEAAVSRLLPSLRALCRGQLLGIAQWGGANPLLPLQPPYNSILPIASLSFASLLLVSTVLISLDLFPLPLILYFVNLLPSFPPSFAVATSTCACNDAVNWCADCDDLNRQRIEWIGKVWYTPTPQAIATHA